MHNTKNSSRRPMTVNYQVPLDTLSSKRPFSSHIKSIEHQSPNSLQLKIPPLPNIREICQGQKINHKNYQQNNHHFYREIPKNTITSLRNESYFWKVKRKISKSSSIGNKKSVTLNKMMSLKDEKFPNCPKSNNPTLPSDSSYSDSKNDQKKKTPNQNPVKNPCGKSWSENKKETESKPCKICTPVWDEMSEKKKVNMMNRPHTTKTDFKLSEFSQIQLDSSAYLLKEIDNIKTEITKMQTEHSKITMSDAVKIINDIKTKIKAAHSTVLLENRITRPRTARVKTPTKPPLVRPSKLLHENLVSTSNKGLRTQTTNSSYMKATVSSFNKQKKEVLSNNKMCGSKNFK